MPAKTKSTKSSWTIEVIKNGGTLFETFIKLHCKCGHDTSKKVFWTCHFGVIICSNCGRKSKIPKDIINKASRCAHNLFEGSTEAQFNPKSQTNPKTSWTVGVRKDDGSSKKAFIKLHCKCGHDTSREASMTCQFGAIFCLNCFHESKIPKGIIKQAEHEAFEILSEAAEERGKHGGNCSLIPDC